MREQRAFIALCAAADPLLHIVRIVADRLGNGQIAGDLLRFRALNALAVMNTQRA